MAAHSRILAWKIPWTEKPGGLHCMVSQRVRHDRVTKPPPPYTMKTNQGRWILVIGGDFFRQNGQVLLFNSMTFELIL